MRARGMLVRPAFDFINVAGHAAASKNYHVLTRWIALSTQLYTQTASRMRCAGSNAEAVVQAKQRRYLGRCMRVHVSHVLSPVRPLACRVETACFNCTRQPRVSRGVHVPE